MVKTEFYKKRADGVMLYLTYSDIGRRLIRDDGTVFDEAVDVEGTTHSYTESDEVIIWQ